MLPCRPHLGAEGDAFHVAFKDVQHAVLFCMEVQYQVWYSALGRQLPGSCMRQRTVVNTFFGKRRLQHAPTHPLTLLYATHPPAHPDR